MFALPPWQFSRSTRPPTNSHTNSQEETGEGKSFLPGRSRSMLGDGRRRERKQKEKSSISVGVQHQQPLWLGVKLLSLVQLKQVDAGSSPLQIRQALVSPSLPPFHRLSFLSEKSSTLSSLPLNPSVLLLLHCYSPDNHFTFSFSPLIYCRTHNPYFPGARRGCYFLLC